MAVKRGCGVAAPSDSSVTNNRCIARDDRAVG
jgi:hypothetical protein